MVALVTRVVIAIDDKGRVHKTGIGAARIFLSHFDSAFEPIQLCLPCAVNIQAFA